MYTCIYLCVYICLYIYIYTVSQKKLHKLLVSELCQMSINLNNFWYVDNRIAKALYQRYISHLTSLISPHYLVKHKNIKFVNNASWRFETWVSKWMGHRLLSRQSSCPEATVIHILDIPEWVFVFGQDGAPAHWARDAVAFLERNVLDFVSQRLCPCERGTLQAPILTSI